MNIERIKELAACIETLEHKSVWDTRNKNATDGFDMSDYHYDCGTPSCIAGWTVHLWGNPDPSTPCTLKRFTSWEIFETAQVLLGLNVEQADELFLPNNSADISPEDASKTLRNLVETGEVHW